MNSSPPLETVLQAVNCLYQDPDITAKEHASVWLGELQNSVYAWQISDHLLHLHSTLESCYFAAQTMRTKIQYSFHELPQHSHGSLRDSLLEHVSKIDAEYPAVIITQLCLALADLALQMATWTRPTFDLITKFGTNPKHWHFLVELLTVLPEEINSRALRLGSNRRSCVQAELSTDFPGLIQLLNLIMDHGGVEKLKVKVFRCLGSWFNASVLTQEVDVHSLLLCSKLFSELVNIDVDAQSHEAATDCVCAALYVAEDLENNKQLAEALFQAVMMLPASYQKTVEAEDQDKSVNFCRIFTEMAESFLDSIVQTPNQGFGDFRMLENLLMCINHPQYEVADITFNFWYRLSELIYQRNDDDLCEVFRPYIGRLIIALCNHCKFDADVTTLPQEDDEFVDFRSRVAELVKDVVFIVGSSNCFRQMFLNLQSPEGQKQWEVVEASLFIMTSVVKNILPEEEEVVPVVLQGLLTLPGECHIAVRHTILQLVGELSEWIEKHPVHLDAVLNFLQCGLQHPDLATVAATSLQSICSQCRDQMATYFDGLLCIVMQVDSFNVSNDAAIGLLKGTALILTKMPEETIRKDLNSLCDIQLGNLQKIIDAETTKVVWGQKEKDPTVWLDRLAAIFRNMNPVVKNGAEHPCHGVVHKVWPTVSKACQKYEADVKIIERCCRCLRFVVRCLGKGSALLLAPLVTQIVDLYARHQHSCFLYLGSILVDEYGTDQGCVPGLIQMLQLFCEPSFKILGEPNGLRNHPDTVDDLFRLCLRFIQRTPVAFLQCEVINELLLCAIQGCNLDQKEANASVTKFLSELARAAREKQDKEDFERRRDLIHQLLGTYGEQLVQALIYACILTLPTYMMSDSTEVIFEIMLVNRETVTAWLQKPLEKLLSERTSTSTMNATPKQVTDFHTAFTSAETVKQATRVTREFSRLFR